MLKDLKLQLKKVSVAAFGRRKYVVAEHRDR